jgi:hypothetical protein
VNVTNASSSECWSVLSAPLGEDGILHLSEYPYLCCIIPTYLYRVPLLARARFKNVNLIVGVYILLRVYPLMLFLKTTVRNNVLCSILLCTTYCMFRK